MNCQPTTHVELKGMTLNYATANSGGCRALGYAITSEVLASKPVDRFATEGKA